MLRKDRPQVAVVGAGYWGKNLLRNFYRLGAVGLLVESDPETLAGKLAEHPGVEGSGNLADVWANPDIKGLVLATPAETHYRLAKEALSRGRHVFVEKPLALSLDEGLELRGLAAAKGLTLMVDHLLQQHPAIIKLKELLAEGALGRILHIYSRRMSYGKIRREENVLWSLSPHDISLVLGFLGLMPEKVSAVGSAHLTPGLADMVEADLIFGEGLTAHLSASWLNPVKEHKLVIVGSERMAVFDDTLPWADKLKLYHHHVEWPGGVPVAKAGEARAVELTEAEPLRAQCLAFLSAMAGGPAPYTDVDEGLRVLTVLSALEKSLRSGSPQSLAAGAAEYFAHPSAVIDDGVKIGRGCKIWHFSHVLSGSELGEDCNLGQNVAVGPNVKIGRGVKIQNNVSVYEGVELEDDVFCGPSMVFTNVLTPRASVNRKHEFKRTKVGRGATIGANATIVCGHDLGPWCFIAAGAVVTGPAPAHALMVGAPARQKGWVCRCGRKLNADLTCPECGKKYREGPNGLTPAKG